MRAGARYAAVFVAGLVVAGAVGLAVASDHLKRTSRSDGTPIYSLRPTGVGLPLVGAHGTLGAGEYTEALKDYHESGKYEQDLERVGDRAHAYLRKRVRALRSAPGKLRRKLALVLDIDETSVSNYSCLAATEFQNAVGASATCIIANTEPPIEPTLELYRSARRKGVAVFFITGRPDNIPQAREQTETNLETAGYSDWAGLSLNPGDLDTVPYKRGERRKIERKGYRIIANVGDQETDLRGGHADRAFKLPNPYYFIGP